MKVAVFGSAPGVKAPPRFDSTIFVNESPCLAKKLSVPVDRTVFSTFMLCGADPADMAHLQRIVGVNLGKVLVLETYCTANTLRDEFIQKGIFFDRVDPLPPHRWAGIVYDVTKQHLGRHVIDKSPAELSVSSGMFSVCLALYEGDDVVICGISMKPGYEHGGKSREGEGIRGHVGGDCACLLALRELYHDRVSTTSSELNQRFGIRMAS